MNDLSGLKFGRLTVIHRAGSKHKRVTWLCRCDCGQSKIVIGWLLTSGQTTRCDVCPKGRNLADIERLLLARRRIDEHGCWIWEGPLNDSGYGTLGYKSRHERVHRLAAAVWNGFDCDSELFICHTCDNPPCFNPAHLFAGTPQDNVEDCKYKGRMNPWGGNGAQKLRDKTHCPKGHPYSGTNLIQYGKNRRCRECANRSSSEAYYRRRYGELGVAKSQEQTPLN